VDGICLTLTGASISVGCGQERALITSAVERRGPSGVRDALNAPSALNPQRDCPGRRPRRAIGCPVGWPRFARLRRPGHARWLLPASAFTSRLSATTINCWPAPQRRARVVRKPRRFWLHWPVRAPYRLLAGAQCCLEARKTDLAQGHRPRVGRQRSLGFTMAACWRSPLRGLGCGRVPGGMVARYAP
jgi:hypothetical protein